MDCSRLSAVLELLPEDAKHFRSKIGGNDTGRFEREKLERDVPASRCDVEEPPSAFLREERDRLSPPLHIETQAHEPVQEIVGRCNCIEHLPDCLRIVSPYFVLRLHRFFNV